MSDLVQMHPILHTEANINIDIKYKRSSFIYRHKHKVPELPLSVHPIILGPLICFRHREVASFRNTYPSTE